jgi:hypothetical protein
VGVRVGGHALGLDSNFVGFVLPFLGFERGFKFCDPIADVGTVHSLDFVFVAKGLVDYHNFVWELAEPT